jgi:cytochrome P450
MFVNFIRHPEQLDLVREDPALIPAAVEESIRHNNSSVAIYRGVTEDIELGGVRVPQGSMVVVCLAAANRDERRFDDPDRFDVTRKDGGHTGFGHGIHLCIGLHMARMEMASALEVVIETMPRLRADPDFDLPETRGALYRHPSHLKVRWD